MNSGNGWENLTVYQQALQWVMKVYGLLNAFPKNNPPSQIVLVKQAAIAVTTHLSECGKHRSPTDKRHHLNLARNAAADCRAYLQMTEDHGLARTRYLIRQLDQVEALMAEYMDMLMD